MTTTAQQLPKQLHVKVTQYHIKDGQPVNCRACPIALAVNSALKDIIPCVYNRVADDIAIFTPDHRFLGVYKLTQEASDFISDFDQGELVVEPFEFIATLK